MKPAAVASALTYATNHGVSLLFLCSTVSAEHWLSRMSGISEEGVKMIEVNYLCNACAAEGVTGVCTHGEINIPAHIETSSEADLVKLAMDLVMPGSYQLEVCGSNLHTAGTSQAAFDASRVDGIRAQEFDMHDIDAVHVALDPVQSGSGNSGIGLAVVGRQSNVESFVVSILAFLESNISLSAEKPVAAAEVLPLPLQATTAESLLTARMPPMSLPRVTSVVAGGKFSPWLISSTRDLMCSCFHVSLSLKNVSYTAPKRSRTSSNSSFSPSSLRADTKSLASAQLPSSAARRAKSSALEPSVMCALSPASSFRYSVLS